MTAFLTPTYDDSGFEQLVGSLERQPNRFADVRRCTWSALSLRNRSTVNTAALRSASWAASRSASICRRRSIRSIPSTIMATTFTPTREAVTSSVIAMREKAMSLISESLRARVSPSPAGTSIIHHLHCG